MELVSGVVVLLLGLVAGFFFGKKSSGGLAVMEERIGHAKSEIERLKMNLQTKENEILNYVSQNASLLEKNKSIDEKIKDLAEVKDKLTKEFENLAHKIFQEKMTHFQKDSANNIDSVLKPFKEKLGEFQNTVVKYREDEIKETSSLKTELQNILNLNQKLSLEAQNLTNALKGDKKIQGNWGELILERVLESSGLRQGEEYVLQGKDMALTNDEGRSFRPDVIIHLPEGKHIIVDSKVTLNGYEKFINAQEDVEKAFALKEFLNAIRNHINGLSEKKYQNLGNILTPDFVLIFIPIEGAFATALQNDSELFKYGHDRKIILVSPTTLMVTLRTIESIWKQEKQNRYALDIAKIAGEIYDKFAGFLESMDELNNSINKSQEHFSKAMNRLSVGRGNVLSRFDKMKELGAKASKTIELSYDE